MWGRILIISRLTLGSKSVAEYRKQSEMIRFSRDKLVKWVGVAIIPIGILLFNSRHLYFHGRRVSISVAVHDRGCCMIGNDPEGLYLLASVGDLPVSSIRLAQKKGLLLVMKCIETLARASLYCVWTSPERSRKIYNEKCWLCFRPKEYEEGEAAPAF